MFRRDPGHGCHRAARRIHSLRFEDDFSYLAEPDAPPDWWDPIKYIPLGRATGRSVPPFGGELRERFEYYADPDFRVDGAAATPTCCIGCSPPSTCTRASTCARSCSSGARSSSERSSRSPRRRRSPRSPAGLRGGGRDASARLSDLMLRVGRREIGSTGPRGWSRCANRRTSGAASTRSASGASAGLAHLDAFVGRPVKVREGDLRRPLEPGADVLGRLRRAERDRGKPGVESRSLLPGAAARGRGAGGVHRYRAPPYGGRALLGRVRGPRPQHRADRAARPVRPARDPRLVGGLRPRLHLRVGSCSSRASA